MYYEKRQAYPDINIAGIEVIINTVNRGRHNQERAGCRPSKAVLSVAAERGPDLGFDKIDWVIEVLGPPSPRNLD